MTCPRCGCARSDSAGSTEFFGLTIAHRVCRHCGKRYRDQSEGTPLVAVPADLTGGPDARSIAPCPKCSSRFTRVRRTKPVGKSVIRYCKCTDCGHTFKLTDAGGTDWRKPAEAG
jgi:hypothetical protein